MPIFNNMLAGAAGQTGGAATPTDYQIDRSLRFNPADTAHLDRTPSTAGNRKTFTFSAWVKLSGIGTGFYTILQADSDDFRISSNVIGLNNSGTAVTSTTAVYRDPSAWYHVVLVVDNTLSSNRTKIYVNNSLEAQGNTYSQNEDTPFNNTVAHYIGKNPNASGREFDGYLADAHFIDGQALAPTDFGEYDSNKNWNPKAYAGVFGPRYSGETWSSAAADSYGFDGSTAYNSSATRLYGSSTYHKIVDATTAFTGVTSVVVGTSENVGNIKLDGTAYTTSYTSGVGLTVTNPPSSFSDIEVLGASGGLQIAYVRVNGELLIDSGVNGNNSFKLNFSDNSSNAALGDDSSGNNNDWTVTNLVATAGADGAAGFDAVTYSGTGSTQVISGLKFQPDLVWIKNRDSSSYGHRLVDSVRGSTKYLMSHNNGAEATDLNGVTSFNSDGFTVGSSNDYNVSGDNNDFIAWAWKAGGTAVSNNSGSIPSTVSANNTYGFSIVKYEGTGSNGTVAHGLSTAPKFFFGRNLDDTSSSRDWIIYHDSIGNTGRLKFNTGMTSTSSTFFQNTSPTNSVITIGTSDDINKDNDDYILYCWSEVSGFSKFGSYTGNGATQTITTGFKPAFVLIKSYNTASNWHLLDSKRGSNWLEANGAAAENGNSNISITYLADGFTVNGSNVNNSTNPATNYIYIAFADTPDGSGVDSLIDTPTNYDTDSGNNGGNYATLSPLTTTSGPLSNGNLQMVGASAWRNTKGTISVSSGKWYFEATYSGSQYGSALGNLAAGVGFAKTNVDTPNVDVNTSSLNGSILAFSQTGHVNNFNAPSSARSQIANGDVIGLALDLDAGSYVIYVNNTSTSSGSLNFTGELTPWVNAYYSGSYFICNFGQRSFQFAPPTGYKSLCTANFDPPTIADGSTVFDVVTYEGTITDTSSQTVTGLNFQSDLVWIKRSDSTNSHQLVDSVRDTGKWLESNSTGAESSTNTNGVLTQFNSNGFTLTGGSTNANLCCESGFTYAAWAWDGGSSTASNTDGSITSNVRANPSAGFSIVGYTADGTNSTVGHGLNAAPELVIIKGRNSIAENWKVYHKSYGTNGSLHLNLATQDTSSTAFNQTAPTSSVFSIGIHSATNQNTKDYIAYCFAPVEGYSAFGSYTGNYSSDGPFVYTGFRPAFILIKGSSFTSNWFIQDYKRDGYNVNDGVALRPNLSNQEDGTTTYNLDILSNGFKLRTSAPDANTNGATFVWAAFASHPFKTSRAR